VLLLPTNNESIPLDYYIGQFKNGIVHGDGKLAFKIGAMYEG